MAKYKKCPRCELNYIKEDEDYCDICKAEMKLISRDSFDEDDMELCAVCGQNFISVDQVMCDACAKKRSLDDVVDESDDEQEDKKSESWDTETAELEKLESTPLETGVDDDIEVVNFSDLEEEDDDDDYIDDDDDSGVDHFEDDDDFDFSDDDFEDDDDDEGDDDDDDYDDILPMKRH